MLSRILVLLVLLTAARAAAQTSQPNIVVILADDLGWADVGWKNPGLHTPTLDRLAREGVILNQSYVQPSCSPSRAAFMSGRYPYHLGLQVCRQISSVVYYVSTTKERDKKKKRKKTRRRRRRRRSK